jgi:hypothetical protein
VKWLAVLLAVAILAAVLWDASERHYDNCVKAAKVRAPVLSHGFGTPDVAARLVARCSRVPF